MNRMKDRYAVPMQYLGSKVPMLILMEMLEAPGPSTFTSLGKATGLATNSISRWLRDLGEWGAVVQSGREYSLTERGARTAAAVRQMFATITGEV